MESPALDSCLKHEEVLFASGERGPALHLPRQASFSLHAFCGFTETQLNVTHFTRLRQPFVVRGGVQPPLQSGSGHFAPGREAPPHPPPQPDLPTLGVLHEQNHMARGLVARLLHLHNLGDVAGVPPCG